MGFRAGSLAGPMVAGNPISSSGETLVEKGRIVGLRGTAREEFAPSGATAAPALRRLAIWRGKIGHLRIRESRVERLRVGELVVEWKEDR